VNFATALRLLILRGSAKLYEVASNSVCSSSASARKRRERPSYGAGGAGRGTPKASFDLLDGSSEGFQAGKGFRDSRIVSVLV